ncbi:unnamed protein product [Didymodactylos carnosus]|uniref:Transmembrane protein n=1 Tax=Didymodactylos carnosus TaxID=1234261 RepID=A0A813Y4S4_9BILA|nr:unnamed protein product [Didymodactylos carnosus]CAF1012629.1 unnamed protein product [Didymodactylos carnosus]CAF3665096.1 unnamed protein product [Didymodactylos carnosus]CAF3781523.1 unnamed protein product [Didymodactylos carnosus]
MEPIINISNSANYPSQSFTSSTPNETNDEDEDEHYKQQHLSKPNILTPSTDKSISSLSIDYCNNERTQFGVEDTLQSHESTSIDNIYSNNNQINFYNIKDQNHLISIESLNQPQGPRNADDSDDTQSTYDSYTPLTAQINKEKLLIHQLPQLRSYVNISNSSSETSLARPLLGQDQQHILYCTPPSIGSINNEGVDNINNNNNKDDTATTSTNSLTPSFRSYIGLYLTDMLIAAFIITPLVNIHWRGGWDLIDIHLLPRKPILSNLLSIFIGCFLLYIFYLLQDQLQKFYELHRQNIIGQFMGRIYTLIVAFAYINQWRGLWGLLDMTTGVWYYLVIETLVSILLLLLMKSVYNLNSAPFLISVDTESYFLIGSRYTYFTRKFNQYTFDFILYEFVEAPLLIIAWRGLYNLSDLFIFPKSNFISMSTSFLSGYALFFILALIQIPIVKCLRTNLNLRMKCLHSFTSNVFHLLAFVSVVQIWRSLWMVCEQYLNIPGYHHLTLWICYAGAFVVLTFGLSSSSLNGPGGTKDNYIDNGPILLFKFDYFTTLLRRRSSNCKSDHSSESSSSLTETIITSERPYRFEPP